MTPQKVKKTTKAESQIASLATLANNIADIARRSGFITYDQLNDLLPENMTAESIDTLISMLDNVEIVDDFHVNPLEAEPVGVAARIWFPDVSDEILRYFRKHPEKIQSMHPPAFEELVAAIFRNQGFQVELTPKSYDGGFDILAIQKDALTGENVHLVECKRYNSQNPVRVAAVRGLLGVVESNKATKGILVTTSYFTCPAHEVAEKNKTRLSLHDYDVLVTWLNDLPLLGKEERNSSWPQSLKSDSK